jgi:hypothetical protein
MTGPWIVEGLTYDHNSRAGYNLFHSRDSCDSWLRRLQLLPLAEHIGRLRTGSCLRPLQVRSNRSDPRTRAETQRHSMRKQRNAKVRRASPFAPRWIHADKTPAHVRNSHTFAAPSQIPRQLELFHQTATQQFVKVIPSPLPAPYAASVTRLPRFRNERTPLHRPRFPTMLVVVINLCSRPPEERCHGIACL